MFNFQRKRVRLSPLPRDLKFIHLKDIFCPDGRYNLHGEWPPFNFSRVAQPHISTSDSAQISRRVPPNFPTLFATSAKKDGAPRGTPGTPCLDLHWDLYSTFLYSDMPQSSCLAIESISRQNKSSHSNESGAPSFRVFCEGRGLYSTRARRTVGNTPTCSRRRAVHQDSISTPQSSPVA